MEQDEQPAREPVMEVLELPTGKKVRVPWETLLHFEKIALKALAEDTQLILCIRVVIRGTR